MSFPLLLLFGPACQLDPAGSAASDYVTKLQPLVHENSLLAERVLFQAAAIYNEATLPTDVATAWSTEITPLAEHLHQQAGFVEPPPDWAQDHQQLVAIWAERAEGYRAVSEALRAADQEKWDRGTALIERARGQESEWFLGLNTRLQPHGIQLDGYP